MLTSKWKFIGHNPAYSPFDDSPSYFYECDQCGYVTGIRTPYCPKCGAKKEIKENQNGKETGI